MYDNCASEGVSEHIKSIARSLRFHADNWFLQGLCRDPTPGVAFPLLFKKLQLTKACFGNESSNQISPHPVVWSFLSGASTPWGQCPHLNATRGLFCGCTYDSANDMDRNCPGITEEEHDEAWWCWSRPPLGLHKRERKTNCFGVVLLVVLLGTKTHEICRSLLAVVDEHPERAFSSYHVSFGDLAFFGGR